MNKAERYCKNRERKIIKAVEEALRVRVCDCEVMKSGNINHVYRLNIIVGNSEGKEKSKARSKEVIARVFGFENWPEDGKLQWIEKKLSKYGIPHAKLIYFTRDKKYFPFGFMVSEYTQGVDGSVAIASGKISEGKYYYENGKNLKKIHKIQVKKFGPINKGQGASKDFLDYKLKRAGRFLKRLIEDGLIEKEVPAKLNAKVKRLVGPYSGKFRPVLIHGDATKRNTVWSKSGRLKLIDWDNAWSGIWIWDFIELSWYWKHLRRWQNKEKRETARREFFRGYGRIEYSENDIKILEFGLHLIKSVERMHLLYYDKKNLKSFKLVRRIFLEDLAYDPEFAERVILVDKKNREIGIEEKIKAHRLGVLHRCFSVLIFNSKGELMLQKRARSKYHSGGVWTNTCCSHPRPGEKVIYAGRRRLREEMGIDCRLKEVFTFTYQADLNNGFKEHEFDHVLVGHYNGRPYPNEDEAEGWRWISLPDLEKEVKNNPKKFSAWLKIILPRLKEARDDVI